MYKNTRLFDAIIGNKTDIVAHEINQVPIEKRFRLLQGKDDDGQTIWHLAAIHSPESLKLLFEHLEAVETLDNQCLELIFLDQINKNGQTIVQVILESYNVELIELLRDRFEKLPNKLTDSDQITRCKNITEQLNKLIKTDRQKHASFVDIGERKNTVLAQRKDILVQSKSFQELVNKLNNPYCDFHPDTIKGLSQHTLNADEALGTKLISEEIKNFLSKNELSSDKLRDDSVDYYDVENALREHCTNPLILASIFVNEILNTKSQNLLFDHSRTPALGKIFTNQNALKRLLKKLNIAHTLTILERYLKDPTIFKTNAKQLPLILQSLTTKTMDEKDKNDTRGKIDYILTRLLFPIQKERLENSDLFRMLFSNLSIQGKELFLELYAPKIDKAHQLATLFNEFPKAFMAVCDRLESHWFDRVNFFRSKINNKGGRLIDKVANEPNQLISILDATRLNSSELDSDIELLFSKNGQALSPFFIASQSEKKEDFFLLISKYSNAIKRDDQYVKQLITGLKQKDSNGNSLLHNIASHPESVKALLSIISPEDRSTLLEQKNNGGESVAYCIARAISNSMQSTQLSSFIPDDEITKLKVYKTSKIIKQNEYSSWWKSSTYVFYSAYKLIEGPNLSLENKLIVADKLLTAFTGNIKEISDEDIKVLSEGELGECTKNYSSVLQELKKQLQESENKNENGGLSRH